MEVIKPHVRAPGEKRVWFPHIHMYGHKTAALGRTQSAETSRGRDRESSPFGLAMTWPVQGAAGGWGSTQVVRELGSLEVPFLMSHKRC